jgi:hypothetical protein
LRVSAPVREIKRNIIAVRELQRQCVISTSLNFNVVLAGTGAHASSLERDGFESSPSNVTQSPPHGKHLICVKLEVRSQLSKSGTPVRLVKGHPSKPSLKVHTRSQSYREAW